MNGASFKGNHWKAISPKHLIVLQNCNYILPQRAFSFDEWSLVVIRLEPTWSQYIHARLGMLAYQGTVGVLGFIPNVTSCYSMYIENCILLIIEKSNNKQLKCKHWVHGRSMHYVVIRLVVNLVWSKSSRWFSSFAISFTTSLFHSPRMLH